MKVFNFFSGQSQPTFMKSMAMLTLLCFSFLFLQNCATIRVQEQQLTNVEEKPSVALRIYLKKPEQGQEDNVFSGVSTTLSYKNDQGDFVEIANSQKGSWILKNAPSGEYKVDIGEKVTIGDKTETINGNRSKTFTLKSDQRVELRIMLKRVPVGFIVVISVLVVGLIIWLIARNSDDLPDLSKFLVPPLPKPGDNIPLPKAIPLPSFPHHIGTGVYIGPQPLFIDGGYYYRHDHEDDTKIDEKDLPPEAVSFYPQMQGKNIPRDAHIIVYFSNPMDPQSFIDNRIIRVIGSVSDIVHGKIVYNPEERKMEFIPENQFALGEQITATLMGKLIKDTRGSILSSDYEWSFTIINK